MIPNEMDAAVVDGASVDRSSVDADGADSAAVGAAGGDVVDAGAHADTMRHKTVIPTAATARRCLMMRGPPPDFRTLMESENRFFT